MKNIFLKKSLSYEDYIVPNDFRNNNNALYFLIMAFEPFEDTWIQSEIVNRENTVYIYSNESFKKKEYKEFPTLNEGIGYEKAYDKYYDKRWEEIPKVKVSIQDWEILKQKWNKIQKERPKYIMFTLDDSGPLDKVDIIGKDELSKEDLDYIKQEHEKYVKYQRARQKYIENHPDYSEVWRGPQDDEYEADIMKYYEE